MRYQAMVATETPDAFDYAFTASALDDLAREALGKEVLLLFTEHVGDVFAVSRGEKSLTILFEGKGAENLIDAGTFYCVPAFVDGRLSVFGLVPAPADSSLTPVRVVSC